MAYRNIAKEQAAPESQAALDAQETIIPDPRAARVRNTQEETRNGLRQALAYLASFFPPFGSKKR